MRLLRKVHLRFRSLFDRSSVEDDLESELRDYVECEIESQIAAGASPDEAQQIVARRMQGKERIKEECRDARGTSHIENLVRDVRYGWRVLLKNPGFSVTASLTLALGIATSTALFSVAESQLWRTLPFQQPEKLTVIWERNVKQEWQQTSVSVPNFADWRQCTRAFESLAAMQWPSQRIFVGNHWTERPRVAAISYGFFETLRARPEGGRTFETHNEQPGNQTVAILSGALARRAFGSAKAAFGRTIKLDDRHYSVIGVLPAKFRLDVLPTPDVFVPLAVSSAQARDARNLVVIGRLRPDVTRAQGLADLETMARRIAGEHPDTNANFSVMAENPRDAFIGPSSRTWLLLSLAFSVFVLLIACFNVAMLQLMRSVVRQREFAVREALGASRGAMFRQAIAESAWLATVGAVFGVLLALAGLHALKTIALSDMTVRESDISVNLWSAAFVVAVSVFATLLFGLAPGFFGSKVDLESALRNAGRSTSNSPRTRRRIAFLSGAEVTLAFLSLFGAGLFAVSCRDLQRIPLGFEPDNISALQISLSGANYSTQKATETFYNKVAEQASSVTGIQQFALSSSLPLTGGIELKFARADRPRPPHGQESFSLGRSTTPNYFHLLGIPIVKGRGFAASDTASSPRVAIINQNLAEHFFPEEDPIGKQLLLLHGEEPAIPEEKVEIVGIAAKVKDVGLDEVPFNDVYLPASQGFPSEMYVIAKTSVPSSVGPLLRRKIQDLDPEQFVAEFKPLGSYIVEQMHSPQFNLAFVSVFSGLALLLTAVALFGTLSFTVAQQTRDIGLRIAVGARPVNIFGMMFRQTFRLVAAGSLCGLVIAVLLGTIYKDSLYMVPHQHDGILYGVSIYDPLSFGSAGIILFLFASVAGLLPALRAMRVDPNTALRCE